MTKPKNKRRTPAPPDPSGVPDTLALTAEAVINVEAAEGPDGVDPLPGGFGLGRPHQDRHGLPRAQTVTKQVRSQQAGGARQ